MKISVALVFSRLVFQLLLTLSGLYAQNAAATAAFRSDSRLVLVPLSVTDHQGKTVNGLQALDFAVFDDGTPQKIVSFAGQDSPCSVGLVLDTSGSMRNTLGAAKDIAQAFFQTANPEDEFLLLTVSTRPDAMPQFTTDPAAVDEAIKLTSPGGMTALIDTIYLGLNRMRAATKPRHALLILSDGMENNSRYSKADLMRAAQETDVQIYAIIVDGIASANNAVPFRPSMAMKPIDQAREHQGPLILEELSEKTGGLHFRVHNHIAAKEAAIKVGQAIRNEYMIAYRAPDSTNAGKWHRIRVKSNVPKVNVYARSGYYSR